MLKKLNTKKLLNEKRKYKVFKLVKVLTLASLASISLFGCSPKKTNNDNVKTKYTQQDFYDMDDIDVEINYKNYTPEIKNKEKIYFTYDNTAYGFAGIENDGKSKLIIKPLDGVIYSSYLDEIIDIPKVNEDEKLIVNVDYQDKTLEAHAEKLEKENTK